MSTTAPSQRMDHAQYVAFLTTAARKYEYLRGEVFAMAGGTPEHARLAMNVGAELRSLLRGRGCAAYSSDLRIRVQETDLDTFPDVTVVCGALETRPDDPHAVLNPTALVEVLSDSTEAYDRGPKFGHYRRIPSLQEYVLVSQREPKLEVFRRGPDGTWIFAEAGAGQYLVLESLGVSLAVDAVFANELVTS